MRAVRWHILREAGALTLARRLPPRFDVAVEVAMPAADPKRLAHQIRQDVWRAVQNLRGFSPVVTVTEHGGGLLVVAGGRVAGRVPGNLAGEIRAVLEDEAKRARWLQHAASDKSRLNFAQEDVKSHKSTTGFDKGAETGQ